MVLQGTIVNGTVVLDQPAALLEGSRVEVVVKLVEQKKTTLSQRLLQHAGTVADLPGDLAKQHDHYIHGTPKR